MQVVNHSDMPAQSGVYLSFVRAGSLVFVSGQAGIVPKTSRMAGEDFDSWARQAFLNLRTCLECSGSSMGDVVKVITWLGELVYYICFVRLSATRAPKMTKIRPRSALSPSQSLPSEIMTSALH